MVVASALAFGFVHIIFGNWLSVGLSAIGGVLFALTYQQSGSLVLTCIEHALFGDFIFTIGIGQFFFHRSAAVADFADPSSQNPTSRSRFESTAPQALSIAGRWFAAESCVDVCRGAIICLL
jgi:hypothetical protein